MRRSTALAALTCFALGFLGAVVFPEADREAAASPSPTPARVAPLFDFSDVFRAEVGGLCRQHVEWAQRRAGLWRRTDEQVLRRLQRSASRLRVEGLDEVFPPADEERITVARMEEALGEISFLAGEAGRGGVDDVIDQAYRDEVILDLEARLRSFSRLVEEQGLDDCALS